MYLITGNPTDDYLRNLSKGYQQEVSIDPNVDLSDILWTGFVGVPLYLLIVVFYAFAVIGIPVLLYYAYLWAMAEIIYRPTSKSVTNIGNEIVK